MNRLQEIDFRYGPRHWHTTRMQVYPESLRSTLARVQESYTLAAEGVHVWHLRLDEGLDTSSFVASLDIAEQERAARHHFLPDRITSEVGHAVLRWLLAGYGIGAPEAIRFEYSRSGKPSLAAIHSRRLEFSLSHTRGMVVLAFARVAVGIDVERLRPVDQAEEIIGQYFAPEERQAWHATPLELRRQAFFNGWTRKEAFLKATGEGLQRPLDSFAVTLAPFQPARLERLDQAAAANTQWYLADVTIDSAFVTALAVGATAIAYQEFWMMLCNKESAIPPNALL